MDINDHQYRQLEHQSVKDHPGKEQTYRRSWQHTRINQGKFICHLNTKFFGTMIITIVIPINYLRKNREGRVFIKK